MGAKETGGAETLWDRREFLRISVPKSFLTSKSVTVVLGMHRSGTSLLGNFLHALGVSMGSDLHPADIHNPAGYFEDRECMSIQERILETLGQPWHGAAGMLPFPANWQNDPAIRPLIQELEAWFDHRLAEEHGLWGFKDPRSTRFLPLWREIFAARNVVPRYLLAIRNPAEVVASEVHRDGVPDSRVYHTWLRYNLEALQYGGPHLAAIIDYGQWFGRGEEQLAGLAAALGMELEPERGRNMVASILRPDLHRQDGANQSTPPWAARVYNDLLALATQRVPGLLPTARILTEFEYFDAMLRQGDLPNTEGPITAFIASSQTIEEQARRAAALVDTGQRVVLSLPAELPQTPTIPSLAVVEREAPWPAVQGLPFVRASFAAYRWLRNRSYDTVHFPGGQGLAAVSLDARRQGWPWRHGPIHVEYAARPDWLDADGTVEPTNVLMVEAACLDRRAISQADRLDCADSTLRSFLHGLGSGSASCAANSATIHPTDDRKAGNKDELPLVTVCITHYNRPALLGRCLESVRAQDYSRLEVVVVDDGSDDPAVPPLFDTLQPEFQEKGWQLIRQENRYLGAARNAAVRAASGEYLYFLDDDNLLLPDAIAHAVRVAERSRADIVTSTLRLFSGGPEAIPNDGQPLWVFPGACPLLGIFENGYGDANALVRRACWEALGGFTEDRGVGHEDWEFFARAVLTGFSLEHSPEPLVCYRVDQRSMAHSGDWAKNYRRGLRPYAATLPAPLGTLPVLAGNLYRGFLAARAENERFRHALEEELSVALRDKEHLHKAMETANRKIAEMEGHMSGHAQQLADVQAEMRRHREELSQVLSSRSWRITRPLREARIWGRRQGQRVGLLTKLHRRDASGHQARFHVARALWRRLPLSPGAKVRLRGRLFHAFPQMLNRLSRVPMGENTLLSEGGMSRRTTALEPPPPHTTPASIIVCVHNALDDVRRCLESVLQYTMPPYELVLVDDGSNEPTRDYLSEVAAAYSAKLLRNEKARGYTRAANQGLKAATGAYLLLLNSDTIVSPDWLDRMVACMESDSRIGIVGPLSNTASWQSVPKVEENGDWAENPLPKNYDVATMAREVARASARVYPRLPFLNGFCLLIRRSLYEHIGVFDEEHFGTGYGEENDYCLRARAANWQLAVADDTYVFHAQSRSYSHERRKDLAAKADVQLRKKYDHEHEILPAVVQCQRSRLLHGTRARVAAGIERAQTREGARKLYEGARVAVVLPVADEGGGGHVIIQECQALTAMGVFVRLLNLECNREHFLRSYSGLSLDIKFCVSPEAVAAEVCRQDVAYDLVIVTVNHCVSWLRRASADGPRIVYYVQDFEPDFYPPETPGWRTAVDSYTLLPQARLVTKTQWNARLLLEKVGVTAEVLGPSVDIDLFRPASRPPGPLRLCAMIRPATPRRAPERTLRVLAALRERMGTGIELLTFGCTEEEFAALAAKLAVRTKGIIHRGRLTRPQMAELLNLCDIFADFSDFQAMGLTALESMACGNSVIAPRNGGAGDFIRHRENGWLVDSTDEKSCIESASELLADADLRRRLSEQALKDGGCYAPEWAAARLLDAGLGRDWRRHQGGA